MIAGRKDGLAFAAVLYDSVTNWAFGPVFSDSEEAEDFIAWCVKETGKDPRHHDANGVLEAFLDEWRKDTTAKCTTDPAPAEAK